MRIISINAWGGARYGVLGPWLETCRADVLCVQEVTHTPGLGGWTRYDDAERSLPQRADLLADIRARLPRHHGLHVAGDSGPVHDEDRRRHRQDFGVATFVHDGSALIGVRSAFLHGDYTEHRDEWPAGDRPRAALAVRLFDRAARRHVTVVNVHGLRDPQGKGDTEARRAQAHRLARLVTDTRRPADLTVVAGDFNVLPDSETHRILADLGLTDLVGRSDTRTSHYAKACRHASYLLVSDPDAVTRFEVQTTPEVSDHRALLLELRSAQ
ncbi:endonuclease [Embleya scabrispora]|uniref:Endonuclease n=1 Tax=Embleya scabrispora TaxID=159449 RepID=A0A1T3P6T9_9ACTN|nr:endonuclease/exonuclease/phosphatase family protein [Embleya scabrispora]OPC84655.1 endonuclease [Embleya scabrispora]